MVVIVGFIYGGNCLNIIFDFVEFVGIICILNSVVREYIYDVMVCKVKGIVDSMGVKVMLMLLLDFLYFIIYNDFDLI